MRIGVVCDTHNHLANVQRIVALFNAARVERVIHTGDVTQPKTIAAFAGLQAPLHGVYGNNDEPERPALEQAIATHGFEFHDPPWQIEWAGRSILVVHDPETFAGADGECDLALHGHTHRLRIERRPGNRLLFNPGECAGHLPGLNAVGVVDLRSSDVTLLRF